MLFVSLVFLFAFLPIVLGIYYMLKKSRKAQNIFLVLASLFFYAWGEPKYVLLLMASILFNWMLAIGINWAGRTAQKGTICRLLLVFDVIINLGQLGLYKYLNFGVLQINRFAGTDLFIKNITLPIGLSFFTFQALSYVVDVYRGEKCQRNPLYVGLYISFFPQLIAGPIVKYSAVAEQIENRKETLDKFSIGSVRFMGGFSKKILLANTMAVVADKAFALNNDMNLTMSFAWLGAIAYSLQIYFDFSGYSDMAIGLGRMFGFEFEENFNYPYTAVSITDFWRRWHISLSNWFRDYVYIPLGGSKTGSKLKNIRNLFVVWILTGIWHGANWTFVVWGLLYFAFLFLEKVTPFSQYITKNKVFGHMYMLTVVCLLWVFFRAESIHQALMYVGTMFGFSLGNLGFYTGLTGVYLRENIYYFVFAVLLAMNSKSLFERLLKINKNSVDVKSIIYAFSKKILLIILFIVSIVYVINGTYNPFIYFNF